MLSHDLCFRDNDTLAGKHKCERIMLSDLKKLKSKTFGEKVMKKVTQGIIGSKYKLGLGVEQKQI